MEYSFEVFKYVIIIPFSNFGDGPLDRVYIDTLSSVSYSFGTFDIDALQTPPCG